MLLKSGLKNVFIAINLLILWLSENQSFVDGEPKSKAINVKRFENIVKSPQDKRKYRGLELENDLKVLLISDPLTETSAVSMTVGVGSISDFRNLPGLANLLGHVLMNRGLLGHEFKKFLDTHNGYTDGFADTKFDEQTYSFTVGSNFLKTALEKFAQFFNVKTLDGVSHTVLEDAIKNLQTQFNDLKHEDLFSIATTERTLSRKNHPFRNLPTGNMETLDWVSIEEILNDPNAEVSTNSYSEAINKAVYLYENLSKFHSSWYSSNIMFLVVLGKESLNNLEKMVVPLFKNVKNKRVKRMIYPFKHHPLGPDQLKREIYIVPESTVNVLRIFFPIPDQTRHYKTAPLAFLNHILHSQQTNTLSKTLKEMDLSSYLGTAYQSFAGIAVFAISFELTNNGLDHVYDIVTLLFQYIHLLSKWDEELCTELFNDLKKLAEYIFFYDDDDGEDDNDDDRPELAYVKSLSSSMLNYPIEDVLSYRYIISEWKPIIKKLISYLSPENMIISIVSQSFDDIANQTERYVQTPFKIQPIPENLIEQWKAANQKTELQLPTVNEYIPMNLNLYPVEQRERIEPVIIYKSPISKFWFKQDVEYKLPKLHVCLEIITPLVHLDPLQHFMFVMFATLLTNIMIKKYHYQAKAAGHNWEIDADLLNFKLDVYFYGFDDKLPIIIERYISEIANLRNEVNYETFEKQKQEHQYYWENFESEEHPYQAKLFIAYLVNTYAWSAADFSNCAKMLQFDEWKMFLKRLFSHSFIQGLIMGNYTKQKAMQLVKIIQEPFEHGRGLLQQEMLLARPVQINEGSHLLYTSNTKPDVYFYNTYFQFIPGREWNINIFDSVIAFLEVIIETTCQMNDVTIQCETERSDSFAGVFVILTSEKCLPFSYVDSVVEEFLEATQVFMAKLTNLEYGVYCKALMKKVAAKKRNLKSSVESHWSRISFEPNRSEKPHWYGDKLKACVGRVDTLAFYEEMLHKLSKKRRKMAIHVLSKGTNITECAKDIPKEVMLVTDIVDFKNNSHLLPISLTYKKSFFT